MIRSPRPRWAALTAMLVALALSACAPATPTASPSPTEPTATPSAEAGDFPRVIAVPAGASTEEALVTIPHEPVRIAALTYETAELVAALGAADRLVMVPAAVTNPALSNHLDDMLAVETHAATESTTNAEAVIQTAPDLVLLSARHGLEDGAGKVLADAGIPVIVLPNSWATVSDMRENITLTGHTLGLDTEAEALVATLDAGLSTESAAPSTAAIRVLVLSNQAGRPFVTAGAAFPLEVLRLAGAENAADSLGLSKTGPISAEQVIQAAPDAILLIDMNGSGEGSFAPILENPAVAALPAVAGGAVLLLEGREIQALGLSEVTEGLSALRSWLAPMR